MSGSTSTKKTSWKSSKKTRVTTQEAKRTMMRKIPKLKTNWSFWMKNNRNKEDKFGKIKTEVGSTSKLLKSKEER